MGRELRDLDLTCPKCGAEDALRLFVVEEIEGAKPFLVCDIRTHDMILMYGKLGTTRVRSEIDHMYCRECWVEISDTPTAYFKKQLSEKKSSEP